MTETKNNVKISPEMALTIKSDIKSLMVKKGYTLNSLACEYCERYNKTMTVQNLGNKINKGTIRYFELLEILSILGYEIEYRAK